jgi:hypothetical protein
MRLLLILLENNDPSHFIPRMSLTRRRIYSQSYWIELFRVLVSCLSILRINEKPDGFLQFRVRITLRTRSKCWTQKFKNKRVQNLLMKYTRNKEKNNWRNLYANQGWRTDGGNKIFTDIFQFTLTESSFNSNLSFKGMFHAKVWAHVL